MMFMLKALQSWSESSGAEQGTGGLRQAMLTGKENALYEIYWQWDHPVHTNHSAVQRVCLTHEQKETRARILVVTGLMTGLMYSVETSTLGTLTRPW